MSRLLLHNKAYVLVCDGSKALFYANVGDAQAISLEVVKTLVDHHPPTRELGTDRPGRSFESMSSSRSAVRQTDWHEAAEATFLRQAAEAFDEIVRTEHLRQAVVIAPARALGILRTHLSEEVRRILSAELARDLVKLPKDKLEAFLQSEGELP